MNAQIRFHAVLVASFAACLSVSGVAFAAQALTLAEAQRRALEIAPQVSGQNAAIRASREMAVAVGRRPDPVLKIGVENVPVNGPDRFTIGTGEATKRLYFIASNLEVQGTELDSWKLKVAEAQGEMGQ